MKSRLFASLLGLAMLIVSCDRRAADTKPRAGVEPVAANQVSAPSLFELRFPLTDADGHIRHLDELRGRPFVASMVYTTCTSVCPRITADLQRLERALPAEMRERTRFVLFSLDPERDTPAALRAFARDHGLDSARWTLLAAGPDDMRTLAAVLDVRFRPDPGGEIAHSAVIVVAGGDGVIRHRQAGLGAADSALVVAVRAVQ
jgi:protein SCO1/2